MRITCVAALFALVGLGLGCSAEKQSSSTYDLSTQGTVDLRGADLTGVTPPDLTGVAPPDLTGVAPPDLTGVGSDMAPASSAWLHTSGNQILHADDTPFRARGANLQDTRQCERCTTVTPSVSEQKNRIDALVDDWGANFIRLTLQSAADNGGFRIASQWKTVLDDPDYVADIVEQVDHIGTKPGVYVLVSIWNDPSLDSMGWPTAQTRMELEKLVEALGDKPHVIFGVSNEPQSNFDGMLDDEVWDAMNQAVQTIRNKETALGVPHHLVSVQGTRGWARVLDYYVTHPITAGGGANVVYETHVYDHAEEFDNRFEVPKQTIPVIIGEFGPADLGSGLVMTLDECDDLMKRAEAIDVPWLAWTFHHACPPNLIEEQGTLQEQCGSLPGGMPIVATEWGTRIKNRLAKTYDAP